MRFDRIVEKHEGPWSWGDFKEVTDFLDLGGWSVLLPIRTEEHPNVKLERIIPSSDRETLTIFLKNTTFGKEWMECGFLAIAEKLPGVAAFAAILYHERFVINDFAVLQKEKWESWERSLLGRNARLSGLWAVAMAYTPNCSRRPSRCRIRRQRAPQERVLT